MDVDLSQQAISLALCGNWEKAILVNKNILSGNPNDIDALNRLAFAYATTGCPKQAVKYAKKSLKINPFDKIAERCLLKCRTAYTHPSKNPCGLENVIPESFIEEPGKTKISLLINLATSKTLAKLDCGDEVLINPQGHRLSVLSITGFYIGRLPDDIGTRIKKLIKLGKMYRLYIKSISSDEVKIFIREIKSDMKAKNLISFPVDSTGKSGINTDLNFNS